MSERRYACRKVGVDFCETARHRYVATEIIAATPEQVFDAFEDAHAWTVWAMPIQKVEWTSPKPFDVGTTRTVYMSGGLTGYEEFIAWERGKRMAFCFTEITQNSIEAFAEDYLVTDLGNGRCEVEWRMAMSPVGFSKVVLGVFGPVMGWLNGRMLSKFRDYVESEVVPASEPTS